MERYAYGLDISLRHGAVALAGFSFFEDKMPVLSYFLPLFTWWKKSPGSLRTDSHYLDYIDTANQIQKKLDLNFDPPIGIEWTSIVYKGTNIRANTQMAFFTGLIVGRQPVERLFIVNPQQTRKFSPEKWKFPFDASLLAEMGITRYTDKEGDLADAAVVAFLTCLRSMTDEEINSTGIKL